MISCNIIEHDINEDTLMVWIYPSTKQEQKSYILNQFQKFQKKNERFMYGQYENEWFYLRISTFENNDELRLVKDIGLVLWASEFNPYKYKKLCNILAKIYSQSSDPTKVLTVFLSVFIKGTCELENITYSLDNFERRNSKVSHALIKNLVNTFQLEFVFIYLGILLKKRLIFYCYSLQSLLELMQIVPSIIYQRSDVGGILYPYIDLKDNEELLLQGLEYFIAGCTDESICKLTDLYDILVDIPNSKITIADHAKESLIPTKSSKEIAKYVMLLGTDQNTTDEQIVAEISSKTKEILSQLRSLADGDDQKISLDTLKNKKLAPVVENFLIQLAKSENILKA